MSTKKSIDIKTLSKELEKLIDITGDSCGPILIKELQERIDKTIVMFNKDVEKGLKLSFETYQDKINRCKSFLKSQNIINNIEDDDDIKNSDDSTPQFIQSYEKKSKKKL